MVLSNAEADVDGGKVREIVNHARSLSVSDSRVSVVDRVHDDTVLPLSQMLFTGTVEDVRRLAGGDIEVTVEEEVCYDGRGDGVVRIEVVGSAVTGGVKSVEAVKEVTG